MPGDSMRRIFWALDTRFSQPRVNVRLALTSKVFYSSAKNELLGSLLAYCIRDRIRQELQVASEAGYHIIITISGKRLQVVVSGFRQGIDGILHLITDAIMAPPCAHSPESFEKARGSAMSVFANEQTTSPTKYAESLLDEILEQPYYSNKERLQHVYIVEHADLTNFQKTALGDMSMVGLIHGNCDKADAQRIVDQVLSKLHFESKTDEQETDHNGSSNITIISPPKLEVNTIPVASVPQQTIVKLIVPHPNPKEANNGIINYYQIKAATSLQENEEATAMSMILYSMSHNYAFHELRTVKGLGYIVHARRERRSNVHAYKITIQSQSFSAEECSDAANEFMTVKLNRKVGELNVTSLEAIKDALKETISKPPMTLTDLTDTLWTEIVSENYNFARKAKLAAALDHITLEKFQQFYTLLLEAPLLSIQVKGNSKSPNGQQTPATVVPVSSNSTTILTAETVKTYKEAQGYHYPLPGNPIPMECVAQF